MEAGIEHYHPDDRPTIRRLFSAAVDEGEPYDAELRLITADGDEKWVHTRGEPQIEDGTVVRVRSEGEQAVLEVEDNGIGMDPETADQFFEAFKQASEGIGREYEGTGLGLTVTQEAVAQMNGQIDVETEKGAGSCFRVQLPEESPGSS